jgi:uncharacterized protein (DUF488 family)
MGTRIHTIGHSRHSAEQFVDLLRGCRIARLVDIRRIPFSRRNPQFNRDRLADDLARHQIGYRHMEDLGGKRDPAATAAGGSPNTAWRNPFLRSYADYAQTRPFLAALDVVCRAAAEENCAIMCAEADWRQCHRQITADYMLARGLEVLHILPDGTVEPAVLTPSAAAGPDGTLLYSKPTKQQLALDL